MQLNAIVIYSISSLAKRFKKFLNGIEKMQAVVILYKILTQRNGNCKYSPPALFLCCGNFAYCQSYILFLYRVQLFYTLPDVIQSVKFISVVYVYICRFQSCSVVFYFYVYVVILLVDIELNSTLF